MMNMMMLVGVFSIVFSCVCGSPGVSEDAGLAFPGAEGFGRFTDGGRSGKVLIVENLNDSGPGSLRYAIEQKYPRTIVFNVAGSIPLQSPLNIRHGDLTIAGQSAPGHGICLKNYPLFVKASNVIIRYVRIRMGDECGQQDDCISIVRQKDVIIDHCSFSWATDEVASAYDNDNFTMQWCIISESLNNAVHQKGEHGYGGIWGGKGASFHHNLLAHHKSRLPRFCGARYHGEPALEVVDFRNNVVYNWKTNNSYGGEEGRHNIVNNYYRPGPATDKSKRDRILNPWSPFGAFYVDGNVLHGNAAVTGDNWKGVHADYIDSCKAQHEIAVAGIANQSAQDAFVQVLAGAGASHARDEVDIRIAREVEQGTARHGENDDGIIDSQSQVGGWPELKASNPVADEDRDGMSDAWEISKGLDPGDGEDHATFDLDDHYTNLEVYLNGLISKK